MPAWQTLAGQLTNANTEFIIKPIFRFKGEKGEQDTMFFKDPSGNPIAVKGFKSLDKEYDS